jgi:adenine-specific DNA methylase
VLLGLLWPDPCDPLCPSAFKEQARLLLRQAAGCNPGKTDAELRQALLQFISNFASWDLIGNSTYLEISRALMQAAHSEIPLVVDTFAGGGSIPLEALRIGCEAYASDLNPVAFMILQTTLEQDVGTIETIIREFESAGAAITKEIRESLQRYYPYDKKEPVGYFWARTVRCESTNCGAEIPLLKSFWLSKARQAKAALRYNVRKSESIPSIQFEVFTPKSAADVPSPTVSRAKARCLCCGAVLHPDRVRAQLRKHRGGTDPIFDKNGHRVGGARLMAVAEERDGSSLRHFRSPNEADYEAVYGAQHQLQRLSGNVVSGEPAVVPDEPIRRVPVAFGVINVWVYGMEKWGDLFSARQALALATIAKSIRSISDRTNPKVLTLLAFALNIFARTCNGNARLRPDGSAAPAFGMQALPFTWAFPESIPWGRRAETFVGALETVLSVLRGPALRVPRKAQVERSDARQPRLPDESAAVWFVDPPYYDAIPYSYLSDFFYVWMKRSIGQVFPSVFAQLLTPKTDEIVSYRIPDSNEEPTQRFERMMSDAFGEGRRVLKEDGIGSIVFAHKTTEGWEALLSGIVGRGWTVTASWPIATEAANRLRARNAAALATSVHLICRPRPADAKIGDWEEVLGELPGRVADWMARLEREGVRGADLVFACIGPALEIFSRYSRVETAEGREVPLGGDPEARDPAQRGYLAYVWEVVGRAALQQVLGTAEAKARNGGAGALEEDARLTALFLWTIKSTAGASDMPEGEPEDEADDEGDDDGEAAGKRKAKGFTLVFDIARRFAQPLGIHLETWRGRIVEIEKGVVRLLPVSERSRQLFGEAGTAALAERIERAPAALQLDLFPEGRDASLLKVQGGRTLTPAASEVAVRPIQATTLDRVHAAMLLQAGGRTNALRALLAAEQDRGPDFLRLANALSALYPQGCEEKRLLDAMLLAVPR